ncbi:MAG: hypothetical protein U1E65_00235 [Myxococcota bacterium]
MVANNVTVRDHTQDHRTYGDTPDTGRPIVRDHRHPEIVVPPRSNVVVDYRERPTVAGDQQNSADAAAADIQRRMNEVMSNPNLSWEDRIDLLMMNLSQAFQNQIDKQAQKVIQLQTQVQNDTKNAKAGEQPTPQATTNAQSLQFETAELDRLTKRLGQLSDITERIRARVEKTVDGAIDGMR